MTDPEIDAAWARDAARLRETIGFGEIPGGVCVGERRAIYYLVAALKPRNVLEIGTHVGASTVVIAQALATHAAPGARLTSVDIVDVNDPVDGPHLRHGIPSPAANLAKLGLAGSVRFQVGAALAHLGTTGERYDLIFLDGDHAATAVYREIDAALQRLAPGGIILLHDYHPGGRSLFPSGVPNPGPALAGERILREQGERFVILPFGDMPWATKDGLNKACLALFAAGERQA